MKQKFIFSLVEYLGESTYFWGDFSKILFFPPLVDIYGHPLLKSLLSVFTDQFEIEIAREMYQRLWQRSRKHTKVVVVRSGTTLQNDTPYSTFN